MQTLTDHLPWLNDFAKFCRILEERKREEAYSMVVSCDVFAAGSERNRKKIWRTLLLRYETLSADERETVKVGALESRWLCFLMGCERFPALRLSLAWLLAQAESHARKTFKKSEFEKALWDETLFYCGGMPFSDESFKKNCEITLRYFKEILLIDQIDKHTYTVRSFMVPQACAKTWKRIRNQDYSIGKG